VSTPEKAPSRENDYLGNATPIDKKELVKAVREFFQLLEAQIGMLNALSVCEDPKEQLEQVQDFLNEQPAVYRSPVFRWVVSAILHGNAEFFREIAGALPSALQGCPTSEVSRQLIQCAGEERAKKKAGDSEENLLEKLRNAPSDGERLKILGELDSRLTKYETSTTPSNQQPTYTEVIAAWEKRTKRTRESINLNRVMKQAGLESASEANPDGLPRGNAGRKKMSGRQGSRIKSGGRSKL
jgi:hypothetical protein